MELYKWLNADGTPCHGGSGTWPLPNGQPGDWIEVEGELVPCEHGLHLCKREHLLGWIGPRLYVAEHDGELIECDDKVVVRRARLLRETQWDDTAARLFACRCIRETPLHDDRHVWDLLTDERSRRAVEVAEQFARGNASDAELAAAWDAAWAASAAGAAGAAARAVYAAGNAASASAGNAAGAAARAVYAAWAARDAAWDAARQLQTKILCEIVGLTQRDD